MQGADIRPALFAFDLREKQSYTDKPILTLLICPHLKANRNRYLTSDSESYQVYQKLKS